MKQRLFFITIFGFALVLVACKTTVGASVETIEGSGDVIITERDVSDFSSIQINMGADLVLTQGEDERLTIEADNNLMQYIQTEIRNGKLIVYTPDYISIIPSRTIQLNITFDTLKAIDIFGRSNITAQDLFLDELVISFSGSGSTRLTGTVEEQTITIHGQATVNNFETSRCVVIDISGNGTIEVNAEDILNVTVAGMGNIRYIGMP